MHFLLVCERSTGRLLQREILEATEQEHGFEDPFWEAVASRIEALQAQYPEAMVIQGMGSSIEAFLRDHPEFQEPTV